MAKNLTILGIETSCDETAAAVLTFNGKTFDVLSNVTASQIEIHKLTGGVVPEVAAREHVTTIIPTIQLVLRQAGIANPSSLIRNIGKGQRLKIKDKRFIDAIAVTAGPGLLPALMVGVDTANALSKVLNIPVIPVQHITGHIYANFVNTTTEHTNKLKNIGMIKFPLLALIVSGGHTEFILVKDHLKFKKLGRTLDDAAGEAFDKTARTLGLAYPGGPEISKRALKGSSKAFNFPRPLLHDQSLNFSFAGLKTAVLYKVQELNKKGKLKSQQIDDLSASIQEAIVDTLVGKTIQALKKYKVKSFTLGGGVAANELLRQRLSQMLALEFPKITNLETKTEYTMDNATMIAAVGAMKLHKKVRLPKIASTNPQWEL